MLPDDRAMADFLDDYTAHTSDESIPYPGVVETLDLLAQAGFRMAVCTNKPEAPARQLLDQLGLARYFAATGGGDSFPARKPDPRHLLETIAAAGGSPRHSVMIGDHANDIEAAFGAGVPSIFAHWGYGSPAMAEGAVAEAQNFSELPELIQALLRRG